MAGLEEKAALLYLMKNKIRNIGLIQVLQRGTAELLQVNERGVYLRDTVSDAYMLSVDDAETGIEWLRAYEGRRYSLLQICNQEVVKFAKREYGLETMLECFQAVYEKEESPECDGVLEIREPDEAVMQLIHCNYDKLSYGELRQIRKLHNLYAGYLDGICVGFIGNHLEGSIGLLEIFPEYRRRGFAAELEQFMIERMLQQKLLAFAQIETWNEKSLGLQKKLGMTVSEDIVYWLF